MFGKSGLKVSALGYGCMTFGDPSNGNVSAVYVGMYTRTRQSGTAVVTALLDLDAPTLSAQPAICVCTTPSARY